MKTNSFLLEYPPSLCRKYKTKKLGSKITATQINNNKTLEISFEEAGIFEIVGELKKPIKTKGIKIPDGFYLHIAIDGQFWGFITHGKKNLENFIKNDFFEIVD